VLILDWRDPSVACGSLGNIVAQALASEYLYDVRKFDLGVVPSEWHQGLWPLYIPLDRIFHSTPEGHTVVICRSSISLYTDSVKMRHNWMQQALFAAGHITDDKINPRVTWLHAPHCRSVLLYPREYDNKNRYFDLSYWIEVGQSLIANGWSINAMLDTIPSHRDGYTSVNWCREFSRQVPCRAFEPTINGLQSAAGLSRVAVGRLNGPAWLLLKSTIPQIVLDDPNDRHPLQSASHNVQFIEKSLRLVIGKGMSWISEL
jgi:hypothetical protein